MITDWGMVTDWGLSPGGGKGEEMSRPSLPSPPPWEKFLTTAPALSQIRGCLPPHKN